MSKKIVQLNEEIIKDIYTCGRNTVGRKEVYEHEASGCDGFG